MQKRIIRALIFLAIAIGVAVGAGSAAGAIDLDFGGPGHFGTEGSSWT
jgi:hypothetical protein